MNDYGIAALSIQMNTQQVQQQVQTTMLKKTMDTQEAQATQMIQQMMPPSNHIIDTYA